MSSVASYKTHVTSQTQYSKRSDAKSSASGYSRGSSAYSQRRKDLLEQEHRKDLEDQLQKQYAEQDRHRKLMQENKMRAKAKQDQLNKELETKKQQEEEILKKLKSDKDAAYIKYLKENSKELLKNFKQKDPSPVRQQEPPKDNKKGQHGGLSYKKTNSLPNELPPKNPKQRLVGNMGQQQQQASGNVNNVPKMSKEIEDMGLYPEFEAQDNLEALDLDISRSTNNFKKIIAQYHKDIEKVKQIKEQGNNQGKNKENQKDMEIPIEQFYGNQAQPRPPTSQLLDSLDLGSSLTNWKPGKQAKNENEPAWKIHGGTGPEERKEQFEEVEEKIETGDGYEEEDVRSNNSNMGRSGVSGRETKKLEKLSEVSQKQLKKDWYLKYVDKQSQGDTGKPPKSNISSTPKDNQTGNVSVTGATSLAKTSNQKSLGAIPSGEPVYTGNIQQKPNLPLPKKVTKPQDVERKLEYSPDMGKNRGGSDWAHEVREDDFFKGLDKQVPSSREGGSRGNYKEKDNPWGYKKDSSGQKSKDVIWDSAAKMNAMEADEPVYGEVVQSRSPRKEVVAQNKVVQEKDKNPMMKKKTPSVTGVVKKENEKENKGERRNSGLRSKLEGHVNAAQRVNRMDNKAAQKGNRKALSPTTRGTRDTDLDVEEFLQDDFNRLNQEEANLQREIIELHQKESGKVREFEQKHNINVYYQTTKQFMSKNVNDIPYSEKIIDEEDLEDSLCRLDDLLSKQRVTPQSATGNQITAHFANPILPSNPPQNQNQYQYQKEPSLYGQVMNREPSPQGYQPMQPQRPQPQNMQGYSGYSQPNPQSNPHNQGAAPNVYGDNPVARYLNQPTVQQGPIHNLQPNPYNHGAPSNVYGDNPVARYLNQPVVQQTGQADPFKQGYSAEVGSSPEFGQKFNPSPQYQDMQYSKPPAPVNQYVPSQNPPQYGGNVGGNYGVSQGLNQGQEGGYSRNIGNRGPQQQAVVDNGAKELPEQQLKVFSFSNKNDPANQQEASRLRESLELAFGDKSSMISGKDNMSETGFRGEGSRMTVDDKSSSYAVKKQQQKEYQTKKGPKAKEQVVEEKPNVVQEEGTKVVCNTNLKHLLFD